LRPNLALTETITLQNAFQLARLVESSNNFSKIKNTLLLTSYNEEPSYPGLLPNCSQSDPNGVVDAKVKQALLSLAGKLGVALVDQSSSFRIAVQLAGINTSEFAPQLDSTTGFDYTAGFLWQGRKLFYVLAADRLKWDNELSKVLDTPLNQLINASNTPSFFYSPVYQLAADLKDTNQTDALCKVLTNRAVEELKLQL
jgi:hypothetical protein